ncbi:SMI1/KNR4 family protein [Kitasatospora griseola]|uniref:SMI1/KNR4 family protein n=1 Tax=Kitasatospora griseola TaxID=2064 RepID=UPI00382DFFAB
MIEDLERALPGLSRARRRAPLGINWEIVEEAIGIPLPVDYKELCEFYPRFEVFGFLRVARPLPGRESDWAKWTLEDLEDLRDSFDAELTEYQPYPAPGGLIPWGASSSGDRYFWKIDDGVAVSVVSGNRGDDFWEFPGEMTLFLGEWISGEIVPEGQPDFSEFSGDAFKIY